MELWVVHHDEEGPSIATNLALDSSGYISGRKNEQALKTKCECANVVWVLTFSRSRQKRRCNYDPMNNPFD